MAREPNELMEDSDLAIQQFVVEETARDYARTLEEDFLKGNIPGKVEGVAVCETAKQVTLAGDEITVTDLKKAYFSLKRSLLYSCPPFMQNGLEMAKNSLKRNCGLPLSHLAYWQPTISTTLSNHGTHS